MDTPRREERPKHPEVQACDIEDVLRAVSKVQHKPEFTKEKGEGIFHGEDVERARFSLLGHSPYRTQFVVGLHTNPYGYRQLMVEVAEDGVLYSDERARLLKRSILYALADGGDGGDPGGGDDPQNEK